MSDWTEVVLGDLIVNCSAARRPVKSSERIPGLVPYYGASGVVDWVDGYTHDGEFLLISEDGENLRSRNSPIAFRVVGKSWVNNHAHVVRGRERYDTRFLEHALAGVDVTGYLTGSAQPKLNRSAMESIRLLIPPSSVRSVVAEFLAAFDDKIAANERVQACDWELARKSFTLDLVNLHNVEKVTLGELSVRGWLVMSDGYRTKVSELGRPGLRILRAGDLRPDRIDLKGDDYVSSDHLKAIGTKASMSHDIVVTTKGTVGRVAVVPEAQEQVVYSPQICYFRVVDHGNLCSEFLAGWFRSSDFVAQAEMRMYKSDMAPYINLKDIQSIVVPVPTDMVDQLRISETQGLLQRLAHSVDSENARLAATRDELLPLLMSGRLRVKDAEKVVEDSL